MQTSPPDRVPTETDRGAGYRPSVTASVIRYAFLPVMLVGVNALGWWLAWSGAAKWVIVLFLGGAITLSFAAERRSPYRSEWNESLDDSKRDIVHGLVNEALQITSLMALPTMVDLIAFDGLWPHRWPFAVQVLFAIVMADAGITMGHRISHQIGVLWRFHAVHHSVKRMYGLNGLMKHPLHQLFETALGTAPLVLLGLPVKVATALVVAVSVQLLLQHSNINYVVPQALRWLLALNVVHRFHHLKWAGEGDVNFGLFTNLWDHLMGTAAWDPSREFESDTIGIAEEPHFPVGYGAQLIKPFHNAR